MRKQDPIDDPKNEEEEPLVDTTVALPLRSKRTERRQKKLYIKQTTLASKQQHLATLCDLPSELLLNVLSNLLPSDIFRLSQVNRGLQDFISSSRDRIANTVISRRYPILTQCFPLPVLLSAVDEDAHAALLDEERQIKHLHIHKKPYQHVKTPDPRLICTCLTCMLAWNNLCVIVDFAYWQANLDHGEPIPMIPRGKAPQWNQVLIEANGARVERALRDRLWYARILEAHLQSTVGSIQRHANNAGNKRRRFRMTGVDATRGDDAFLARSGPPSTDFPWHRDNYYMLEAYLPNRGWNSEVGEWRYMSSAQHDIDVRFVTAWAKRKRDAITIRKIEADPQGQV